MVTEQAYFPDLTKENFQWRDANNCKHPLWEIDDLYLNRIIALLERRANLDEYGQATLKFLRQEWKERQV